MSLVIDASVALKWVLDEEDSQRAEPYIAWPGAIAPDFLVLECGNVLASKVWSGRLTDQQAADDLDFIQHRAGVLLHPSLPHMSAAHRLATRLHHSAYDCLYLALAMAEGAQLATADGKFAKKLKADRVYSDVVLII